MISKIYHFFPIEVWEGLILIGMIGLFVLITVAALALADWRIGKDEDDGKTD